MIDRKSTRLNSSHRSEVPFSDGSWGHLAAAICVAATGTSGVGRRRRSVTVVDVELQYFDDCPNWRVVDEHLRSLAAEFAEVTVTHRLVNTPEEADRVGFRGSPTVLVNGVDPFATEVAPVGGLSCRVYPTPDGPIGSPTLEQLRRALGART